MPGVVGSAIGHITTTLVRALRERHQMTQALAGCARLADLLEAEPDLEAFSYYAHLMAWELAQLPAKKAITPMILLDTFEDIGDRTNRDLERVIQRIVWLMPAAFFIITGRSRLQWADEGLQGQLDFTGPTAWPGLAAHIPGARSVSTAAGSGGSRQILIGDFSPEDCERYLARRLTRDSQPLIDASIRETITTRSHGLPLYLDLAVMRFLEIRRTRTPEPADFDHDFPALIARTLSDLTPDERHVLRSVTLLDAFDTTLATRAAGLTHEAAALRLTERPFIRENPFGLWPYHLHGLIRSTIRSADDHTDDRWSEQDWQQAAARAFAALGEQWTTNTTRSRMLLVACLRQGLTLARDHRLDLDWLTKATWAYVSDWLWEPIAPPTPATPANAADPQSTRPGADALLTPADALVETLSALARRQHEHRSRTADRLTTVVDTGLLPADLNELAVYYLAKAQRDLGRHTASRQGMQLVADGGGHLAPAARRGLAHLARLAGDFPAALQVAETLGWKGRHHRVLGDIWWPHGDMDRAAAAYEAARTEAEQHAVAGERATAQAQRAFTLAFTDPDLADDEIDLADHLLTGLDLRATTLTTRIAALLRDAGTDADIDDRVQVLRAETAAAGVTDAQAALELALCFHHAVQGNLGPLTDAISGLRALTSTGDPIDVSRAYYVDIAHFMADLPLDDPSAASWLDGPDATRARWRTLVTNRCTHLGTGQ
ncbi:ATP/GTP-binding protein [Kitasatospora sp. NPDC001175]|uniref:ATP/GTP-binding protein n=1 Tax=Kitasatospora sp. NPDC001175 TaxID=3157103 RepID=UPI003CFFAF47